MLFDTHCHLYFDAFSADLDAVLARMAEAGVVGALVVGIDAATNSQARALATAHSSLHYAAGLHPTSVFPELPASGDFDATAFLAPWWTGPWQPRAVGECGIDLHWDTNPLEQQLAVFIGQLRFARDRDLPVIVHSRDADAATRQALEAVPGARGVLHCFNGSPELLDFAAAAERRGSPWYVSFAGNLTYPRAVELHAAAGQVPLDRLLIETDAPFMAPQSQRGRRNEPAYLVQIARRLAELRGLAEPELVRVLATNSRCCFGLD